MKCRLPIGPPCSHPCIRSGRRQQTPVYHRGNCDELHTYSLLRLVCFKKRRCRISIQLWILGQKWQKSRCRDKDLDWGLVDKNCSAVIRKVANVTLRKYSSQSHVGVSQCSCARGSQDETRQFKDKTVIPAPPDSSRSYPSTLPSIASTLTKRGGMPRIKTVTSSSHFLKLCIIRNLNRYQDSRSQHEVQKHPWRPASFRTSWPPDNGSRARCIIWRMQRICPTANHEVCSVRICIMICIAVAVKSPMSRSF